MDVTIECICPPKGEAVRHPEGDTVTLRDSLDFRSALAAKNSIVLAKQDDPDASTADILAILTETYLLNGISGWTVRDEKGKAVEANKSEIRMRLLTRPNIAMTVGDAADSLYLEAVVLPLVQGASTSSPATPTSASTSPTNGSSDATRSPSRRSLTSTTPTVVIEPTSLSPAGVSS